MVCFVFKLRFCVHVESALADLAFFWYVSGVYAGKKKRKARTMTITINKCFEVLSVVLVVAALVLSDAATAEADVHKTYQQNPVLSRFHEW